MSTVAPCDVSVPAAGMGPGGGGALPGLPFEHLWHVGWPPYQVESYVNWCEHGQEVIPFPLPDGSVRFVPVPGQAR
jgi:hypothetical protein